MIVTQERLSELVAVDREKGLTLAMANGCFDLLHVGHIRYLRGAAAEADRLIVAVNDDQSVEALKGQGRPLQPASERAEIVEAFEMVDYVVLFSSLTAENLLRVIRPDVHCKGNDSRIDSVPERDVVLSYGGRTVIVGDPKDHATRDLIVKMGATKP